MRELFIGEFFPTQILLEQRSSSCSTAASMISCLNSPILSIRESGTSPSVHRRTRAHPDSEESCCERCRQYPVKSSPSPSGYCTGKALAPSLSLHHGPTTFSKSAPTAVHLIDQRYTGDAVAVGLSPHRLRLRLDPTHGTEQGYGAIEDAQRPLHLGSEINVPRRIDDVDAVLGLRCTPNEQVVAAEVMVIPRSCSCSIQSIVAAPSWTSPTRWSRPV